MYKRLKTTKYKELLALNIPIIIQGNPIIYKAKKDQITLYSKTARDMAKLIGCKVYKIAYLKAFPTTIEGKHGFFIIDRTTIFDEFGNK